MEEKFFEIWEKNDFFGDFSCFFAIKSLESDGNLRKPVDIIRLVAGYLQIGSDILALTGKKSYEFLKVEKSQKLAIFVFFVAH